MRTAAAGISDVGLQRDHNEDSFSVLPEYDLYVVADGMGGHRAGDVASRIAVDTIAEFFRRAAQEELTWPFHFDATLTEEENRLLTAIRLANRQIHEHSTRSTDLRGMGTTVVGALFSADKRKVYVAHVGDSRAYRVRGTRMEQITRDHSLLNDYLAAMPDMTEEQRSDLPRNVITRALGMQDNVEVEVHAHDVYPGDAFVLCSDGLSGMLNDEEILEFVRATPDEQEVCRRLLNAANEHGGEDNITAVVVRTYADSAADLAGTDSTMPVMPVPSELSSGRIVDAMAKTPPGGVQAVVVGPVSAREQADTLPGVDLPAPAGEPSVAERPTELPAEPAASVPPEAAAPEAVPSEPVKAGLRGLAPPKPGSGSGG
ncbi:MAG TPA: Stp1/IreP family PP2C-type Ser/Thr phosphatase [Polyangiaceae bacterium]|nr:Stp1/IreP family PP2C-type Ser/Thr phosphatase [Polyangiaceae bacterium]